MFSNDAICFGYSLLSFFQICLCTLSTVRKTLSEVHYWNPTLSYTKCQSKRDLMWFLSDNSKCLHDLKPIYLNLLLCLWMVRFQFFQNKGTFFIFSTKHSNNKKVRLFKVQSDSFLSVVNDHQFHMFRKYQLFCSTIGTIVHLWRQKYTFWHFIRHSSLCEAARRF